MRSLNRCQRAAAFGDPPAWSTRDGLCNAIVGRPFQADVACRVSLSLGRLGQPGKADLQMRCKAGSPRLCNAMQPPRTIAEFPVSLQTSLFDAITCCHVCYDRILHDLAEIRSGGCVSECPSGRIVVS